MLKPTLIKHIGEAGSSTVWLYDEIQGFTLVEFYGRRIVATILRNDWKSSDPPTSSHTIIYHLYIVGSEFTPY